MKISVFFALCITLFNTFTTTNIFAQNNYAQICVVGENLYVNPQNDTSYTNVICTLEHTYFVNILFETDNYYKVSYNGVTGYAKQSAVKKVYGTPQKPYPNNIKLSTYSKNCYLRSTPTQNSLGNNVMLLPANTEDITFVGRTNGTRIEDFGDNTWYYVQIGNVFGYIFSGYVINKPAIYPNTEVLQLNTTNQNVINPLSNSSIALIVTILLIPALVIVYLIYHKPKATTKHRQKTKLKHDDNL